MRTRKPPAAATWLLNRLAPGQKRESLIGDLIEQHQRGRSTGWYWRQAISVIGLSLPATLWRYKSVAIGVVTLNTILPYMYLSFLSHWVIVIDRAWYPHLMNWLIETEWNTARHAVYGLTTGLTTQVAWCVLISAMAWMFVRLRPDARPMVVTLFVVLEIAQCIPGLRHTFAGWLHEPSNLIGFLTACRFAIFTFVAIPLSILWGGRAASWEGRRECAA